MAALIRVKRRIDEEPLNAFVLNCKKRKITNDTDKEKEVNEATDDEISTILRFAGTVKDGDDFKGHITRLTKVEAEESVRKIRKPSDITLRNRQQFKEDTHKNRFKVVNCTRPIEENDEKFTIVDVVKHEEHEDKSLETKDLQPKSEQQTSQAVNGASSGSGIVANGEIGPNTSISADGVGGFVYDLYVADGNEQAEFDDNLFDNLISIHPYQSALYDFRENVAESDYDSEDSNDENNVGNDYPDTDEDFSVDDDDMRMAVEDLNIGSDHDLSTDESDYGPEPVVHFLERDEMTEYQYFKKYGCLRANQRYYRKANNARRTYQSDSKSDEPADSDSNSEMSAHDELSDEKD